MFFVYCWGKAGQTVSDYNKRLIQLSVIQLSGGHCILDYALAIINSSHVFFNTKFVNKVFHQNIRTCLRALNSPQQQQKVDFDHFSENKSFWKEFFSRKENFYRTPTFPIQPLTMCRPTLLTHFQEIQGYP